LANGLTFDDVEREFGLGRDEVTAALRYAAEALDKKHAR
jgi:uncharacterized protein (DUF433 family)